MWGLLRKHWRLFLLPVVAVAFFFGAYFGAYFFFYRGGYDPPPKVVVPYEQIGMPSSSFSSFAEVPPIRKGVLLVDEAHLNNFEEREIGSLTSRVEVRGYSIEFLGERNSGFPPPGPAQRVALLDEGLRRADSFAVILPRDAYNDQEMDIIEQFVDNGGKLILVGDPTRRNHINSLAERFGITFQPDYLYNMVENDLNFQNIIIRNFSPDEITTDLTQIALYTAGSIKTSGTGLALTDANTRSSLVKRAETFYPLVKGGDGHVLAISDLTFMISPQNSIMDNDRLISNIADFLTASDRSFELVAFPYFFKTDVDILLGRASLFDLATDVKTLLSAFQTGSDIRGLEDLTNDTVYLGLYEDSTDVSQYLAVAGIDVDGTLRTPFTPDIATEGTAVILLHRAKERSVLVILGHSVPILRDMINRLGTGTYRSGLVGDLVGVYRSP